MTFSRPELFQHRPLLRDDRALSLFHLRSTAQWAFYTFIGARLRVGVPARHAHRGADMPVVISLLNSYAGLRRRHGPRIDNKVLIIAGFARRHERILFSILMSRAMNRSFANVLSARWAPRRRRGQGLETRTATRYTPGGHEIRFGERSRSSSCPATAGGGAGAACAARNRNHLIDPAI